jgi:hypothetical protein
MILDAVTNGDDAIIDAQVCLKITWVADPLAAPLTCSCSLCWLLLLVRTCICCCGQSRIGNESHTSNDVAPGVEQMETNMGICAKCKAQSKSSFT